MTSCVLPTAHTPLLHSLPDRARSCTPRIDVQNVFDATDEALYSQARGRILPAASVTPVVRPPRAESCPPSLTAPQGLIPVSYVAHTSPPVELHAWWPILAFAVALGVFAGKNYAPGQKP